MATSDDLTERLRKLWLTHNDGAGVEKTEAASSEVLRKFKTNSILLQAKKKFLRESSAGLDSLIRVLTNHKVYFQELFALVCQKGAVSWKDSIPEQATLYRALGATLLADYIKRLLCGATRTFDVQVYDITPNSYTAEVRLTDSVCLKSGSSVRDVNLNLPPAVRDLVRRGDPHWQMRSLSFMFHGNFARQDKPSPMQERTKKFCAQFPDFNEECVTNAYQQERHHAAFEIASREEITPITAFLPLSSKFERCDPMRPEMRGLGCSGEA